MGFWSWLRTSVHVRNIYEIFKIVLLAFVGYLPSR